MVVLVLCTLVEAAAHPACTLTYYYIVICKYVLSNLSRKIPGHLASAYLESNQ